MKCLALLKEIDLVGLSKILRHKNEIFGTNDSNFERPVLDFDINYLFMNKSKPNDSIKMKVEKIIAILLAFHEMRISMQSHCRS